MSNITYSEGQEISFGVSDGSFKETGFLDGATVTVVEARYGKSADVDPKYQDPKNPIPPRIVAKFVFEIAKQDGTTTTLKPQEYSTGIQWDGEKATATVSPDGKRLIAKKGFTGFNKSTDFYHLLETAVNAGLPEDAFRGDISVFDTLKFQLISEPNPRARTRDGKEAKPKPFFALLLNGSAAPTPASSTSSAQEAVNIDPNVLSAAVEALSSIVSESPTGSITRRDIAAKVPPVADRNKWDLSTRVAVMNALFEPNKLSQIASAAGLNMNGDTITQAA